MLTASQVFSRAQDYLYLFLTFFIRLCTRSRVLGIHTFYELFNFNIYVFKSLVLHLLMSPRKVVPVLENTLERLSESTALYGRFPIQMQNVQLLPQMLD